MNIEERLNAVEERISRAAESSGRRREEIKLLAVTKTHSVEMIKDGLAAGIQYIGENKVQEAEAKIPVLKGFYKEFHYIGHLQTNKINKLLNLKPALIHAVDNLHLIEQLNSKAGRQGIKQPVLLQVNTSGEQSKFGVSPAQATQMAEKIYQQPNLKLQGLMTIGRFTESEKELRESFSLLRRLFEELKEHYGKNEFKWLSMGMSNDFEIAIKEGANLVRLGTVIFGPRACSLEHT